MAACPPRGLNVRQRTPVSARARQAELPPPLQRGIAFDNDAPSRHHVHTVVRTPNGNEYGRDLLRQLHARFDHTQAAHRH
jgi:hypothetical protein